MMERRDEHGKFGLRCLGAVAVFALWTATAQAHKPLMMIEDNEDGTITVAVGFSDGESGAGAPIVLKAMADGRTLWEGELDARGAHGGGRRGDGGGCGGGRHGPGSSDEARARPHGELVDGEHDHEDHHDQGREAAVVEERQVAVSRLPMPPAPTRPITTEARTLISKMYRTYEVSVAPICGSTA